MVSIARSYDPLALLLLIFLAAEHYKRMSMPARLKLKGFKDNKLDPRS